MIQPPDPPAGPTYISSLRVVGARGERGEVVLEDGTELLLSADHLLQTGLRTGDPVDAQMRAVLDEAALLWRTREAALRLLSHRARATRELARKLREKGFPSGVVDRVLEELTGHGYLDDAAYARAYVRDRLRLKPRGRRALEVELRRKGVGEAVVRAALEETFQERGTSDAAIAVELARGWLRRQSPGVRAALRNRDRTPQREKAVRRYQGFMARRGMSGGVALSALDAAREGD